ncbi:Hypothetical predicted protein [Paramuricea clavata]|uniref:Uncharacterized protein n=1 Tax=Paramuricea clavata TaxID=317549 RepID=A0A6S7GPI9_PARCT|nr:Hypothetical predicted protein [Paramuricea clavata]
MLYVLHEIHNILEKRAQVDTVYLDFAKAFDNVSHDLLLVKLHNFGIRGNLLRWFGDYLSGRLQRVTVLGVTSEPLPVLSGVPQGSILGPLLFLIYVNDLPKATSFDTTVTMFADDTKCHRPLRNLQDTKILQQDLDKITNWCHDWRMDLNQTKNISIKTPARETRNTNATNGILLEVAKYKTVSYQNSFYVRVANVWNTLPYLIREANKTVVFFKFCLMKHYNNLTKEIYNPEDPRTFKSVCVK